MGDYVRWAPPQLRGRRADAPSGALFLALNRGKRSVRIDLKTEAGREVLLRLARDADVLLESFRPGVLDRLGVGYERLREDNPRLVYCAITGYGQDGPYRDRSGHDIELPRRSSGCSASPATRDGPPVQAAGQIADLGGGALMAAFGILAALRERDRSGEGQLVDVSMTDGALSWLAMVAARVLRRRARRRGAASSSWRAGCSATARTACADGWVTLGALEPKFWRGVVPRRRPRGPRRAPVRAARLAGPRRGRGDLRRRARAPSGRRSPPSTTAAWSRCSSSTRRSTPSSCARARWSSSSTSPAPARRCGCSACRSSSRARPATRRARRGPGARRAHRRGARRGSATAPRRSRRCKARARSPGRRTAVPRDRSWRMSASRGRA